MTTAPVEVDRAPEPDGDAPAVVVRLGSGRFALDLAAVAEVGRVPDLTRIPGVPSWLAGVANWRGRLLPVLDVRGLLGAEPGATGLHARLVVVSADGVTAGILVDGVEGTGSLGTIEDLPSALPGAAVQLLSGQVPLADGPVAVLDARAVLRLRDDLPRGRRSA